MFVLKIIVVLSALLSIGFSTTQCDSENSVEFQCRDPECTESGGSFGQFYSGSKSQNDVLGFNSNSFLVKSKRGKLSVVDKNKLKIKFFDTKNYKFNVSIDKKTSEVCKSSNLNHEESSNDSVDGKNIAHGSTNTDHTVEASDTNDTLETGENINPKSLHSQYDEQINNTTDSISLSNQEEIEEIEEDNDDFGEEENEEDENEEVEDENELNLSVDSFNPESSKIDINSIHTAKSILKKSVLPSSDAVPTSDPDYSEETSINTNVLPNSSQNKNPDIKSEEDLVNKNSPNNDQVPNLDLGHPGEIIFNKSSSPSNDQIPNSDTVYSKENLVNTRSSSNSNHISNLNTVSSEENDSDKKINLKNSSEPATSQNLDKDLSLDNSSSSECYLDSCVKDPTSKVEKEPKENITTEQLSSNNSSVNVDDSDQHNYDHTYQTPKVEKLDSVKKGSSDNIVPHNLNNFVEKVNETQKQENKISESLSNNSETVNEQSSSDLQSPSLENEKSGIMNNDDVNNNISSNNISAENTSQNNVAKINETQEQPIVSDLNIDKELNGTQLYGTDEQLPKTIDNNVGENETKADLSILAQNDKEKDPESQNLHENELPNVVSNNKPFNDKSTDLPPLQKVVAETENNVSSTDQKSTMNNNQYKPVSEASPYENAPNNMMPNVQVKSKEFVPQSFVSSFGHPEACSGVTCLKFDRNIEKTIKSTQHLNPVPKKYESDQTLSSTNPDIENKITVNEITTEQSSSNFFDIFQDWLSSPTMNSIDFLWSIFDEHTNKFNNGNPDQKVEHQKTLEYSKHANHSELYFIVVAVVTLLFSLIYYKYQKSAYENNLLTLLAAKDQSLLIAEKELSLLKEQNSGYTKRTAEENSEIEALNECLTKSEDIISSQAIRIEKLEQEVEELTESGMEMHTLLSSTLESNAKNTEKLNTLKTKLIDSENLVAALTQKSFEVTEKLEKKNEIVKTLQTTVDELTTKTYSLIEENDTLSSQLAENSAKNMLKESKLLGEINHLQFELDKKSNALVVAENEASLSKEALQEMLSQKFNQEDAKKYFSSIKSSTELKSVKQTCEGYKHKLNESKKSNKQFIDRIDILESDIVNLKNNLSKLEKEKEESVNKLNILTKFFKEQEKEYLKQINERVALYENKEGESSNLNERIKFQNQEIANYKSEIQSLKKEITDQEASFKIQISAADKKASDYWISFRQAERKLKEMELETAQLRNRLTVVDKKLENGSKSIDSSKDFEDELLDIPLPTVSPDFTLLDFEPPPPIFPSSLQHTSVDQRLPPLGALGQAPSPPAPLSRRHNRSLSPGSPPPSQRSSVFRPLPQRYNYMNRQNSLGHSVESLDKMN